MIDVDSESAPSNGRIRKRTRRVRSYPAYTLEKTINLSIAVQEANAGLPFDRVLLETIGSDWLVLGAGINVARYPAATDFPATSLWQQGSLGVTVEDMLEAFCRHFLTWYNRWRDEGFAPIRARWLQRARGVDEEISVRLSGEIVTGVFDYGLSVSEAIDGPRWTHIQAGMGSAYPQQDIESLNIEDRAGEDVIAGLKSRGHRIESSEGWFRSRTTLAEVAGHHRGCPRRLASVTASSVPDSVN